MQAICVSSDTHSTNQLPNLINKYRENNLYDVCGAIKYFFIVSIC
jgi:hypothetical protein